jgi:Mechanosensitive ion channel
MCRNRQLLSPRPGIPHSSIIAVVVGLALRPIILAIFSGVSANLEAAFRIGDWIEITRRGGAASQTGGVEVLVEGTAARCRSPGNMFQQLWRKRGLSRSSSRRSVA